MLAEQKIQLSGERIEVYQMKASMYENQIASLRDRINSLERENNVSLSYVIFVTFIINFMR